MQHYLLKEQRKSQRKGATMEDNRKIDLPKKEIPYMEKFMVPQMYDIFRFGGELKDEN